MNGKKNVSVEAIQKGIDYLETEFMAPLTKIGENLIDEYTKLNENLNSEEIDKQIKEQQNKLDSIKDELERICNKAKVSMDDSSKKVAANQNIIDETLSNT